uniref:Cullin domain-containing protein n=1 Tax=Parastrongyloides trichosuri TaxID=131310 RepID=A0A0N4Z209_PARTI
MEFYITYFTFSSKYLYKIKDEEKSTPIKDYFKQVENQFFEPQKSNDSLYYLNPKTFEINIKKLSTKLIKGELSKDQCAYLTEITKLIHKILSPYLRKDTEEYIFDRQMDMYINEFSNKLVDAGVVKRIMQEKNFLTRVEEKKGMMTNYSITYKKFITKLKTHHEIIDRCFKLKNYSSKCIDKFNMTRTLYNKYLVVFKNISNFNNINDLRNKFIDDIAFSFRKHVSQIGDPGNTTLNELYTFSAFDHLEYVLKIVNRDWHTIMNFYDTKVKRNRDLNVKEFLKLDEDLIDTCYRYIVHPYQPNDDFVFKKKKLKIEPTFINHFLENLYSNTFMKEKETQI